MNRIVLGVDPDAERHGVAIYIDGRLEKLERWQAIKIMEYARATPWCLVSIEDVMANQFVYARNQRSNKTLQSKIAMNIGRCQQAQVELMRLLDHVGSPYVLYKPRAGNWAKNKALFEKATGWIGRSNEDTRAAAFFGFLALQDKCNR